MEFFVFMKFVPRLLWLVILIVFFQSSSFGVEGDKRIYQRPKGGGILMEWPIFAPGYDFGRKIFLARSQLDGTITRLAIKIGSSGVLDVRNDLPAYFAGRVVSGMQNKQLQLSNIRYNDSLLIFEAYRFAKKSSTGSEMRLDTLPVHLNITGPPELFKTPPTNLEVSEYGNLSMEILFEAYPKPTATLQWSGSNAKIAMIVEEKYKFVYAAKRLLKSVSSNLCGKSFKIVAKNSVGNSVQHSAVITVLFDFGDINLRARKPHRSCIEAEWQKKASGACNVTYSIKLKDNNGITRYTYSVAIKQRVLQCGIPSNINITKVELTVTSTKRNQTFSAMALPTSPEDQFVIVNKSLSSPKNILASKKESVWLYWNYTLNSCCGKVTFIKQQWIVHDVTKGSIHVIAERIGLNGTMKVASSLPRSLIGRVAAFASNNTLRVNNLQFNDTLLRFQSVVYVTYKDAGHNSEVNLSPSVNINVTGPLTYLSTLPRNLEVSEDGNLPLVIRFDGNPKPSAELQWSHLDKMMPMIVHEEYPFVYKAMLTLKSLDSSYCGKQITIRAANSIAAAANISATVTVLFNFSDPNIQAKKPNRSCVEVGWQKKVSGRCNVKYLVRFLDSYGWIFHEFTGSDVSQTVKCGFKDYVNISQVELQISSTKRSMKFTAPVLERYLPPTTTATNIKTTTKSETKNQASAYKSNSSDISLHLEYGAAIIVLLAILIALLVWNKRLKKTKEKDMGLGEEIQNPNYERNTVHELNPPVSSYMELQKRELVKEVNYASLSSASYETTGIKPKYENVSKH